MPGPHCQGADLSAALHRCPFLHNVAQTHGESYAVSLAVKPSCPHAPVLAEDEDYFSVFHGRGGVLPLPHLSQPQPEVLYPPPVEPASPEPAPQHTGKCPYGSAEGAHPRSGLAQALAAAPMASMSMSWGSNWFNIHHLFKQHLQQHRAQQRKPPQQPQQRTSAPSGGVPVPGLGPGDAAGGAGSTGGKCPLRRALGPLAGIVFTKSGHLVCPEPIIRMRAALAATVPVQKLRPQALPIKLLTVALTTAALNVPCGMWREHTEKFSSQWFLAVHATIPFVAMVRKAVIMPKFAILFTICAAIAGQAMGAKMERRRMTAAATDELAGLARARPAAAGPPLPPLASAPPPSGRAAVAAGLLPVASMSMQSGSRQQQQPAAASRMPEGLRSAGAWPLQEEERGMSAAAAGEGKGVGETASPRRGRQQPQQAEEGQGMQFRLRVRSTGARRAVKAGGVVVVGGCKLAGAGGAPVTAMLPVISAC